MRTAILLCLFAEFGYIANAQLTLLPQVGLDNARTKVEYNDLSPFSPGCLKTSPQVGLRLDYKFNQKHGPYIGLATRRSITEYSFSNPETGGDNYSVARANAQISMEAGYQLRSKPIYFKQKSSSASASKSHQKSSYANAYKGHCQKIIERSGCGRKTEAAKQTAGNKGTWVRLLPSLGVAYVPSAPSTEIETKSDGALKTYQYNAGNWRTAITGGMGFEFGRNANRGFLISLDYLKGVGSGLDSKSITTVEGNKMTSTKLSSRSSSWNLRMGIPISLSKKKQAIKEQPVIVVERIYKEEKRCGQYKTQYKSRCNKTLPEQ